MPDDSDVKTDLTLDFEFFNFCKQQFWLLYKK